MFIKEARENNKVIGEYGISFLDDFLGGIRKSDMVLIGADTGCGKSSLAYQIAFNNAAKKKKVHLFALEADKHEPHMKEAYTFIADQYYNKKKPYKHVNMSYREFLNGNIDEKEYEPELTRHMDTFYNLEIHYKEKDFTIDTLVTKFNEVALHCDIIILDHIDYFDIMGANENLEVTEILKELRTISIEHHIPIIILSHIRKSQFKQATLPHKDDFMGTSNKTKITKTSILLSPDFETCDYVAGKYGTYIQIPKDRAFGKTNLVARCVFDRNRNKYLDKYELHKIVGGEPHAVPLEEKDLPLWAVNCKKLKRAGT